MVVGLLDEFRPCQAAKKPFLAHQKIIGWSCKTPLALSAERSWKPKTEKKFNREEGPSPGIIKWEAILGVSNLMQIYGDFEGFPL